MNNVIINGKIVTQILFQQALKCYMTQCLHKSLSKYTPMMHNRNSTETTTCALTSPLSYLMTFCIRKVSTTSKLQKLVLVHMTISKNMKIMTFLENNILVKSEHDFKTRF